MAFTTTAPIPQTPRAETVQVTTANPNRTDTGSFSGAFTAVTNGTIIEYVMFKATGNTAAGTLRVFYASDGSTYRLIGEVTTNPVTVSGTVPADQQVWLPPSGAGLIMIGGSKLKFSTENTETWNVTPVGADF